jgi:AFG3 family protein
MYWRREYSALSRHIPQQPPKQQQWMSSKTNAVSTSSLVFRQRPFFSLSSSPFYNFFDLFAKIPKGFEDFYPDGAKEESDVSSSTSTKNNNDDKSSVENEKAKETNSEENHSSATNDSVDKSTTTDTENMHMSSSAAPPPSSNGDKNDDTKKKKKKTQRKKKTNQEAYEPDMTSGLLAALFLIMFLRSLTDANDDAANTDNGQEITYIEFRNQLLLPGLVEKIVVLNGTRAIVHLKPNASSLAAARSGTIVDSYTGTTPTAGTAMTSNDHMFGDTGMSNDLLSSVSSSDGGTSKLYYFNIGSMESFEEKITKAQAASSIHPESWVEIQYVTRTNWMVEFIHFIPSILMIAMLYLLGSQALRASGSMFGAGGGRGGGPGGIFSIGKSPAKKIKKEDISVTFADVAGCDEAKKEIMEFVDFLKDSSRFTKLGAKIPKGALLCGPPGTGKTLLAKAVAGEAGVPFYSISGSDFIEMFVGVGPSRVRDLFKEARANAPCIIFIDEIDAVGRKRGEGGFRGGGNDERENTLNQLLVEMDGFSPTTGIVVLAGTNRVDILDGALTRPGRFDRQVQVDRPDLKGRKDIFKIHLKGLTLEGPIDDYAGRLAGLTPGFAGADIANICNEAAIVAARRKGESVSVADFEKATDRIIGGLESNKIMSEQERRIVAHHEAGHAMAGWFLEHADPILKVTIIPRTSGALGFAQYLPKEVYLRSKEQIMDVVCMALAGRAAEEVFFGDVTTGASDDLRRVTELVYSTIKDFGMNSSVGQLAFPTNNDTLGDKPYSDSTAEAMDDEARRIVDAMYLRTVDLIRKHKTETEKVANLLLEQETITHDDIVDLVGPRPFQSNSAYQEYVTNRHTYDKPKEEQKDDTETSESIHEDLTPGLALSLKY